VPEFWQQSLCRTVARLLTEEAFQSYALGIHAWMNRRAAGHPCGQPSIGGWASAGNAEFVRIPGCHVAGHPFVDARQWVDAGEQDA
jgi:hypothetical protein